MTETDLDDVAELLGDPEVMRHYPRPRSRYEALRWIRWNRRLYRTLGYGLWTVRLRSTGQHVGDCGLTPQQVDGVTELELGYHVRSELQGRGYASEAAAACVDHARRVLAAPRVVAIIDPANEPSQRVALRAGLSFSRRARYGAGQHVRLYAAAGGGGTRPRSEAFSPARRKDGAMTDLSRFHEAQQPVYDDALAELRAGRKRTHWMWFVFPQLDGLGSSPTARRYAIRDLAEARAYLADEVLGARLAECAGALLAVEGRTAEQIMGYPDDLKLRSSMTLFREAAGPAGQLFSRVLDRYYDGEPDQATLQLLRTRIVAP